jgi:cytochrome c
MYRHNALHKHQELVAARTAAFVKESKAAAEAPPVQEVKADGATISPGELVWKSNCTACHQKDQKLVGPPMTEMVAIYKGNTPGLKKWIKAPGKKRPDYPQMPGFAQLTDQELTDLTEFILTTN